MAKNTSKKTNWVHLSMPVKKRSLWHSVFTKGARVNSMCIHLSTEYIMTHLVPQLHSIVDTGSSTSLLHFNTAGVRWMGEVSDALWIPQHWCWNIKTIAQISKRSQRAQTSLLMYTPIVPRSLIWRISLVIQITPKCHQMFPCIIAKVSWQLHQNPFIICWVMARFPIWQSVHMVIWITTNI